MTLKLCWLFYFYLLILVLRAGCQERITIYSSSGKNEISYEKTIKTKTGKISNKPILVIKQPEFNTKTVLPVLKENSATRTEHPTDKEHIPEKPPAFVCPLDNAAKPLFSFPCTTTKNCGFLGKGMLCCSRSCLKGVKPPKAEHHHEPIFFGMIQRKCPVNPLPELSEVKKCISDDECSPRICCGEILQNGEKARYCRTPIPIWDTLPLPTQVLEPLKSMTAYMQCTPPPPPYLDLFPKPCQNPLDCFPNLCCQEKGKKFCRPPKRSLLALVAEIGQKIIPEDAAKKFIERIS